MTEPYARAARKIVAWEEPPETRGGTQPSIYTPIAAELRNNPGKWARLDDRYNSNSAYQFVLSVRHGKPRAFSPAGSFEAEHDGATPYVRYVGEPEDNAPLDLTSTGVSAAPDPAVVRQWARRVGLGVSERGAVPQRIVEAYLEGDPTVAFS